MKEIDRAKKEEFERKTLIESLEKMPARVVATAYLYAMNYELYGEDVTKKWQTAVQNTASLQRAYLDGCRDEAQRQAGYPVIQPVPREALNRLLITHEQAVDYLQSTGWLQEHDRQMMLDGARKLPGLPEIIYCKDCRKHNKKVDSLVNITNALPTIQPKRGKWIRTGSGSLYDNYECSECGKAPKWECMGDNRWKIAFTDFCPNCGAKMEVNHESN